MIHLFHRHHVGHATNKHHAGPHYPTHDADREVIGHDCSDNCRTHDRCLAQRHSPERSRVDRVPIHRRKSDDEHHGDQRGHRNLSNDLPQGNHQHKEKNTSEKRREACTGLSMAHIDHGLPDHRAPALTADEGTSDIRNPQTP